MRRKAQALRQVEAGMVRLWRQAAELAGPLDRQQPVAGVVRGIGAIIATAAERGEWKASLEGSSAVMAKGVGRQPRCWQTTQAALSKWTVLLPGVALKETHRRS